MRILFPIIIALVILACNSTSNKTEPSSEGKRLPESFLRFYEKFHSDSVFQMGHVIFPLAGQPSHRDSLYNNKNFYWQKDDWKIHRAFDPSNETFVQTFEMIDENMIIDFINTPDGNMHMQRRFAKLSDGWHLIYFADLQFKGYE
jgi:hypothetical protein